MSTNDIGEYVDSRKCHSIGSWITLGHPFSKSKDAILAIQKDESSAPAVELSSPVFNSLEFLINLARL
jgi:hypothetical protein